MRGIVTFRDKAADCFVGALPYKRSINEKKGYFTVYGSCSDCIAGYGYMGGYQE